MSDEPEVLPTEQPAPPKLVYVLTYGHTDNPQNLPAEYPALCEEHSPENAPEPETGWLVFNSPAEYDAYLTLHISDYQAAIAANKLALAQTEVWLQIKAYRQAIKARGVKVNGYWFHTDADSRIQYLQMDRKAEKMVAAGATPATTITAWTPQGEVPITNWKTMTGERVPMTVEIAQKLPSYIEYLDARAFGVADYHLQHLLQAGNPAEYDFNGLWPAVYGG